MRSLRHHVLTLLLVAGAAVAVVGASLGGGGRAQGPLQRGQGAAAQFTSSVQLVEVYATVTDAQGSPITGLKASDFEVYENQRRQEISAFAEGEFPLTVALGIDRSWSMAGEPLRLARQASAAFLRALKPGDRSMVVAISSGAEVLAPLSVDRVTQIRAIEALDPWGTTALHDGIIAALDRLAPEPGRQALVVFSDGADRYSRATETDVLARARRGTALVYPIAVGRQRPRLLVELAVLTGGRSFLLREARELEPALSAIARELRHQYLLGYVPSEPIVGGEREWRSIRVVLRNARPGARGRARDGYSTE